MKLGELIRAAIQRQQKSPVFGTLWDMRLSNIDLKFPSHRDRSEAVARHDPLSQTSSRASKSSGRHVT